MKILIALDNNKQLESDLSEHFGYCKYFAIYDYNTKNIEYIENDINHTSKDLTPVDQVSKYNIDLVFTLGIGQRAINLFKEKNIKLKKGNYTKLSQVIENINNLEDIQQSCNH
jgi:predicted Fe-Mo cluster-binding NifX family protein